MNDLTRVQSQPSPFDRIKQVRPDGSEFWSARQMQTLMAYAKWQAFSTVIARARQAASNTGMDVASNFTGTRRNSSTKPFEDFELTRQAAYLVAMNGDPNKPEVAAAQAYFAVRTEQAESIEAHRAELPAWASALHALVDQQAAVEVEQRRQADQLREIGARVTSVEGSYGEFTALGYAKLNDLPADRTWLAGLGKRASAVLRADGLEPHRRQDATFGLINTYPTWALDAALAEIEVAS